MSNQSCATIIMLPKNNTDFIILTTIRIILPKNTDFLSMNSTSTYTSYYKYIMGEVTSLLFSHAPLCFVTLLFSGI